MELKFRKASIIGCDKLPPYWLLQLKPELTGSRGKYDTLFSYWMFNNTKLAVKMSIWHNNEPDRWFHFVMSWVESWRTACENNHLMNSSGGFCIETKHLNILEEKDIKLKKWSYDLIERFWDATIALN